MNLKGTCLPNFSGVVPQPPPTERLTDVPGVFCEQRGGTGHKIRFFSATLLATTPRREVGSSFALRKKIPRPHPSNKTRGANPRPQDPRLCVELEQMLDRN